MITSPMARAAIAMLCQLSIKTKASAMAPKMQNRMRAVVKLASPLTKGRCAVRFTPVSSLRSAISLMMQPAARMIMAPNVKISISLSDGLPWLASHSAHSVGHSRSSMPIGL